MYIRDQSCSARVSKTMSRFYLLLMVLGVTLCPGTGQSYANTLRNLLNFNIGAAKFVTEFIRYYLNEVPDMTPEDNEQYDFIVVGAGSAGATIASRLSEVREAKVLLIEAGGHENLLMDMPLTALFLQFLSPMNWDYLTEPSDKYCLGRSNHQCRIAKGRVMGGSSALNFMIATRGEFQSFYRDLKFFFFLTCNILIFDSRFISRSILISKYFLLFLFLQLVNKENLKTLLKFSRFDKKSHLKIQNKPSLQIL